MNKITMAIVLLLAQDVSAKHHHHSVKNMLDLSSEVDAEREPLLGWKPKNAFDPVKKDYFVPNFG